MSCRAVATGGYVRCVRCRRRRAELKLRRLAASIGAALAWLMIVSPVAAQEFPDYSATMDRSIASFVPPLRVADDGNPQSDDDMKGLATRRAVYWMHERDQDIGLLEKTTGSNSKGFSADVAIHRSGAWVDMATTVARGDGTREVRRVWITNPPSSDPAWLARWREPTAALAGLDGGGGGGDGGSPDHTTILTAIAAVQVDVDALQVAVVELAQAVEGVRASLEAHRAAWRAVLAWALKWVAPALAAAVAGLQVGP